MRKPENGFAQLIKGDWIGQKTNEGFEHDQTTFLMFADSMCQRPYDHDGYWYEIVEDTLYIRSMISRRALPEIYPIVKLTKDSLILLSGMKYQDTTRYTKTQLKNNISPDAIYFANPGCFNDDACPVTYLEIDSNRNVRYYSEPRGYKGKLRESLYNSILSKIRTLPVDSLKEYYSASRPGDETLAVAIAHDNKITHSLIYGHKAEPMELYMLLTRLDKLDDKQIILQPDSSVTMEYFISNPVLKPIHNIMASPPPAIRDFASPKQQD